MHWPKRLWQTNFSTALAAEPGIVNDLRGALSVRAGHNQANPYPQRNVGRVDSAVIHYTAGSPDATTEGIARYQIGPTSHLAFPGIAYHMVANHDGSVDWCHDFDRRTWGSDGAGWNERGIHIVYAGNVGPTSGQKAAIKEAIRFAQGELGRELAVVGHKDTGSTSCPGPQWPGWRAEILP